MGAQNSILWISQDRVGPQRWPGPRPVHTRMLTGEGYSDACSDAFHHQKQNSANVVVDWTRRDFTDEWKGDWNCQQVIEGRPAVEKSFAKRAEVWKETCQFTDGRLDSSLVVDAHELGLTSQEECLSELEDALQRCQLPSPPINSFYENQRERRRHPGSHGHHPKSVNERARWRHPSRQAAARRAFQKLHRTQCRVKSNFSDQQRTEVLPCDEDTPRIHPPTKSRRVLLPNNLE